MNILLSLGPCLQAVLQVLSIVLLGVVLSWRGLLPPQFVKTLAALLFDVLLPCILFTSVLRTITWEKVVASWIYPLWVAIVVSMGFAISFGASVAMGLPDSQRRMVVLTAAFPNSGYLPLLLLPAMCRLHPAFNDDPGAADRSIGYVSVYVCFLSTALWVIATLWMARPAVPDSQGDEGHLDETEGAGEQQQMHGSPSEETGSSSAPGMYRVVSLTSMKLGEREGRPLSNLGRALQEANLVKQGSGIVRRPQWQPVGEADPLEGPGGSNGAVEASTEMGTLQMGPSGADTDCLHGNLPSPEATTTALDGPYEGPYNNDIRDEEEVRVGQEASRLGNAAVSRGGEEEHQDVDLEGGNDLLLEKQGSGVSSPGLSPSENRGALGSMQRWLMAVWRHPVVTNPLLASLTGLLLGVIAPIRGVLVTPNGPLNWMFEAGVLIGQSATPLAMMIMGAQLYGSLQALKAARSAGGISNGIPRQSASMKKLVGSLVSSGTRLVLVPLGASVAALALHSATAAFGDDPLLMVTLLAEASTPGALNLIIIAMRQGHDSHAIAEMLMWHYVASVITLTLVLSLVMEVVYGGSSS